MGFNKFCMQDMEVTMYWLLIMYNLFTLILNNGECINV